MLGFLQVLRTIAWREQLIANARKLSTQSEASHASVRTTPELPSDARVILPISMNRYDGSESKRLEYDAALDVLLTATAEKLEKGEIKQVDVVSTAELHTTWSKEKTEEITDYFHNKHRALLMRYSHCYKWTDLIQRLGPDTYAQKYNKVKCLSDYNSEWYRLMESAHKKTVSSESLESSLEYQRREYAGILSMSPYTHILYFGRISPPWSYIYNSIPDESPPAFVRAMLYQTQKRAFKSSINDTVFKAVGNLIEEIIASPNIPTQYKLELHDYCNALFRAHLPSSSVNVPAESSEQHPDGTILKP